jgi:hypothetical protein
MLFHCVFATTNRKPLSRDMRYIQNQKKQQAKKNFAQEWKTILEGRAGCGGVIQPSLRDFF